MVRTTTLSAAASCFRMARSNLASTLNFDLRRAASFLASLRCVDSNLAASSLSLFWLKDSILAAWRFFFSAWSASSLAVFFSSSANSLAILAASCRFFLMDGCRIIMPRGAFDFWRFLKRSRISKTGTSGSGSGRPVGRLTRMPLKSPNRPPRRGPEDGGFFATTAICDLIDFACCFFLTSTTSEEGKDLVVIGDFFRGFMSAFILRGAAGFFELSLDTFFSAAGRRRSRILRNRPFPRLVGGAVVEGVVVSMVGVNGGGMPLPLRRLSTMLSKKPRLLEALIPNDFGEAYRFIDDDMATGLGTTGGVSLVVNCFGVDVAYLFPLCITGLAGGGGVVVVIVSAFFLGGCRCIPPPETRIP
mmetsp:Transcript_27447/g.45666  ORF Transcript_27447/g.45666 Transcript_27447/m.45666 type:complete len:360 (-) Transcript_27447:617-1696(-)